MRHLVATVFDSESARTLEDAWRCIEIPIILSWVLKQPLQDPNKAAFASRGSHRCHESNRGNSTRNLRQQPYMPYCLASRASNMSDSISKPSFSADTWASTPRTELLLGSVRTTSSQLAADKKESKLKVTKPYGPYLCLLYNIRPSPVRQDKV